MVLAFLAKREIRAVVPFERYGVASRVAQASYGIGYYLAKTVVPLDLTAYHPLPDRLELTDGPNLGRTLAVVVVSVLLIALRRRWPGLLAAWAAFLVMLAPNLGLVRLTSGLVSDRYSYLASMSLAALAAAGLWRLMRWNRVATTTVGVLAVAALSALSWLQCRTWHDSVSLWTHAIAHGDGDSPLIRNNLGAALAQRGRLDEAIEHYEEAVRLSPGYVGARFNLATALTRRGRQQEAVGQYRELLLREPDHAEARYNLGLNLARLGRFEEAAHELAEAARLRPDSPEAFHNWGLALAQLGRDDEAIQRYREALRLRPDYPAAQRHLDEALARLGKGG
jgi:tetratricopeptide (TPR) repeat protein